jgi:hypothetical protein
VNKIDDTYAVFLTRDEILLLDGHCHDEIQKKVDIAKAANRAEVETGIGGVLAKAVAEVLTKFQMVGMLTRTRGQAYSCGVCYRSGGYARYKRNVGLYRKGEENRDKPLMLSVTAFNGVGMCSECYQLVYPCIVREIEHLRIERRDLPVDERRYLRHENVRCKKCGWEGHEGEMGQRTVLMGGGTYPATCPSCDAENRPLMPQEIVTAVGFTVVENPEYRKVEE